MIKILKNKYFQAFLLSLALGCLIIGPSIIAGKGILTIIADYNFQEIPFNELMNTSIKNGDLLWTWYNDLGTNFIGSFSFYNLTSPFNLFGFLFPADWFPYLAGPIFILKYGVAGLTSYLFLQQYVKDKKWALIGSLLYAFSGFQLTNMLFYHFHDVVAFFPLLLYSLDCLVKNNKKWLFCLCIALAVFTNYFFFIGEVIFLIIYYIVRTFTKSYNFNWKNFSRIWFEGLLGVGLAMVILLPSLLFVMDNPRISDDWNLRSMFAFNGQRVADILRSLFFPSEIMHYRSSIMYNDFVSCDTFLPFVSCVLAFAYLWKKPKCWMSILFVICLIFMFIPILNQSFFAFTPSYYARWFYMPILIMSLLSIRCLEENIPIKSGVIITIILIVIFGSVCTYLYFHSGVQIIYNNKFFLIYLLLFVICLIGTCISVKAGKFKFILILIGIILYVAFRGNYFFYQNKGFWGNDSKYVGFLNSTGKFEIVENGVRTNGSSADGFENLGYLSRFPYLRNFNSNLNGSNFEFYHSIQIPNTGHRTVKTEITDDELNLHNFLSVKYLFSYNKRNEYYDRDYKLIGKENNFYIYENENYKKMGISYNYYISSSEYEKYTYYERRDILNKAIVLSEEQIEKYGKLFKRFKDNQVNYVNELKKNDFSFEKNGFKSNIETDQDTLILYTIPYDDGWTATINGKKTQIEKVDNGLIAIKAEKGQNKIEFTYMPPGLKVGMGVSIVSLIILLGLVIYGKLSNKK